MRTALLGKDQIRTHLIQAGVKNLRAFGYPSCDEKNILTDRVYSAFFRSMLIDNRGVSSTADPVINELLDELTIPKDRT